MVVNVGCCGFARGMRRYFSQFQVVEVQQTFYKPPRIETALSWRRQAPPNFEFTVKAWQLERMAQGGKVVILCSERLPWRCHRRFIAGELVRRGWRVCHVIDANRSWEPEVPVAGA